MAAYTVVIDQSGGYAVEIQSALGSIETVGGFKTEADASQWLEERQRSDEASRMTAS